MSDAYEGRLGVRRRGSRGSDARTERVALQRASVRSPVASRDRLTAAQGMNGRRRRPNMGGRDRPSRLRFLLSILFVTSLMLVLLQSYRQMVRPRRAAGASIRTRASLAFDRLRGSSRVIDRVAESVSSGAAVAAQRERKAENEADPLSWTNYISAMRHHFRDQLNVNQASDQHADPEVNSAQRSSGGAGMAIVPGEEVRDHEVDHEPKPIPGKTKEEALRDRRAALEELDQETLKAMYDALYGRGA